ncbi:hypothetical protein ACW9HQ_51030, partial [Nocardia gipuzkoensis]
MSKMRFLGHAVLGGIAAVAVAAPAQAEPLWPGGPDLPGVGSLVQPAPIKAPCGSAETRACLQLSTNEG